MKGPEDKPPAEVLRAKRLEIVDDEGKIRAVLGSREEGIGGLSVFDEIGRVRARLEAGEIPEQGSGLSVFDTNGKPRAVVSMDNDPDKGSGLVLLDTEGKYRAVVSLQTGGQAGLSISAGKKDRAVWITAMEDGNVYLMLRGNDAPMVGPHLERGGRPRPFRRPRAYRQGHAGRSHNQRPLIRPLGKAYRPPRECTRLLPARSQWRARTVRIR